MADQNLVNHEVDGTEAPRTETQGASSGTAPEKGHASSGSSENLDLSMILDVPVRVSVEVGRRDMRVEDLLRLTQGSVVELNRMAGEPVDVLVNGMPVARGEVIVVEDNFAVRLTEVVSPTERYQRAAVSN
jgi:flagellar motor switch protein FliN/FliY